MILLTCISHILPCRLSYFSQYISHSNLLFKKSINRILQTKLLRFMHRVSINYSAYWIKSPKAVTTI